MKNFILILLLMMTLSCSKKDMDVSGSLACVSLMCMFNDCTKASVSSFSKLEFLFIDSQKKLYKRVTQLNSDINFGNIEETLPCGVYDCVVVGHSSEQISINDNVISFPKAGDTFYGKERLDLNTKEDKSFVMDLNRIVSRIEVVATDAMPANALFVNMNISNSSESFNLHTSLAVNVTSIQRSFQLKLEDVGRKDIKFGMTVFNGENSESVLSFSVLDENKKELNSFTTDPFFLLPNVLHRFSGHAFLRDQTTGGKININDEWNDVIEHQIP